MAHARTPERVVLEGVPYIGPNLHMIETSDGVRRCPEGTTLPYTVRACLEYAGDAMGSQAITIDGERWRIVPLIQQARAKDAEAIAHISRALGEQADAL